MTSNIPQTRLEHILRIKGEGSEKVYATHLLLKFLYSIERLIFYFSACTEIMHTRTDPHILILLRTHKQNSRRFMPESKSYAGNWADIVSSDFNHEIRSPFRLTASRAGL